MIIISKCKLSIICLSLHKTTHTINYNLSLVIIIGNIIYYITLTFVIVTSSITDINIILSFEYKQYVLCRFSMYLLLFTIIKMLLLLL
jgi:hypothetical protein